MSKPKQLPLMTNRPTRTRRAKRERGKRIKSLKRIFLFVLDSVSDMAEYVGGIPTSALLMEKLVTSRGISQRLGSKRRKKKSNR